MTRSVLAALAAAVIAMSALAAAGPAQAADPCPTGQATYLSTGAEQCYTVPPGVSTVHVVAVGGSGGAAEADATIRGLGGVGAQVNADLAVTGGQTLYVEVGGNGADGDASTDPGAGGFNGGGSSEGYEGSSSGAGGGGGASDVRTQSCAGACPGDATSLGSRLLVAAGGGGGGDDWLDNESDESLAGGAGGTPSPGGHGGGGFRACAGGGGATESAGGEGGDFMCAPGGTPENAGGLGTGGRTYFGGGGGAGLYGGGAGNAGEGPQTGGGGGSSFGPSGAVYALDTSGTPRVVISALPRASTGAAGAVGLTTATLHGTVDPGGQATTYHFEYGTSTTYGSSTPAANAGADAAEHAESADLTGLRPLTTYHFRLVATNAAGTSVGADQVFTTTALAPSAQTDGARDVTGSTATVSGTVDPRGVATSYRFQYGTTTAYGSSTPSRGAGSGTAGTSFSAGLAGLRPGTTYHYRILATSPAGATSGGDRTFTTLSPPPRPRPAPAHPQPQPRPKPKPKPKRKSPKRHSRSSHPRADLALRMRARPHRVRVGEHASYTLRVTNRGPHRATHVVVSDHLPSRLRLVSERASGKGRCAGRRRVTCRFGHLAHGHHVTVRIAVRAVGTGRARPTAHVSARQHDPRRANNHASTILSIVREPRFTG